MKNNNTYNSCNRHLTKHLSKWLFISCLFLSVASMAQEQEEEQPIDKPVRYTFNSVWLLNNQSVMVSQKGTFEFDISHRFGTIGNGYEDLYGLYASSNIRLGFSYSLTDRLSLGFGLTRRKHILDLNVKYSLLEQMSSGRIPVSVTYFGNLAADTRKESVRGELFHSSDRYSFFHQLIVARKFTPWLSLQLAGSLSHFNMIDENMKNDHFAISGAGKVKITETLFGVFNIDQPITKHTANNPNPNVALGLEIATSGHAFQIFLGNYSAIVPQENNMFNSNNYIPDSGENFGDNFLIGFNITRLWNF